MRKGGRSVPIGLPLFMCMKDNRLERRLIAAGLLICAFLVGFTALATNRLQPPEIYIVLSSDEIPGSEKLPSEPVNINTCTKDELMILPGIGEILAERILAYREKNGPFRSADDLLQVSGIGEGKLAAIRDYIATE